MTKTRRVDFYAADWIEGVADLDLGAAAVGVYIQLCAICYAKNTPTLPTEETIRKIARQFGDNPRTIRAAVSRLIGVGKIVPIGDELEPNRVRMELSRSANRRDKFANAGRIGGKNKGLAEASLKQRSSDALASSQQPAAIIQQPAVTPPSAPASPRSAEFEFRVLAAAKIDGARWAGNFSEVQAWRNSGCSEDDILGGVGSVASRQTYSGAGVRTLRYFRQAVEEARDVRLAAESAGKSAPVPHHRREEIASARVAEFIAAREQAKADGLTNTDPEWPTAEGYGFWRNGSSIELLDAFVAKPYRGKGAA